MTTHAAGKRHAATHRRRMRRAAAALSAVVALAAVAGLARRFWRYASPPLVANAASPAAIPIERLTSFQRAVVGDLQRQVRAGIHYQDGYYHGGEPPADQGVCTDVVIRAFRAAGIDLHRAAAEDIRQHRSEYPIMHPDPNIDHRRCRNLVVFFQRHAASLPVETADWQPGDLVFWDVGNTGHSDHVGIVAIGRTANGTPTVVHHWPGQPVAEADALHRFRIAYHFRWRDTSAATRSSISRSRFRRARASSRSASAPVM